MVDLHLELTSNGGNAAGFVIPDPVVADLGGGGRPKVVLTVNGHSFRGSIARMGGQYLLGVSQDRRAEAGIAAGDSLDITIELDTAPRTVDVPEDLALVLTDPALATAWAGWSFTNQKEAVRGLVEAKRPETRASRLQKLTARLTS